MESRASANGHRGTNKSNAFRVGKVKAYLRGKVWYLCYYENGERHRPRVGPSRDTARKMAAQINGQLEVGAPSMLSYEAISIPELRQRWLAHHEHVLRSSLQTINRYRTATEHLLNFAIASKSIALVSHFRVAHAEEFVRYLRGIRVAPNGHANAAKRPLLDKGIQYVLETCRALFAYPIFNKWRWGFIVSPYSMAPGTVFRAKPVVLISSAVAEVLVDFSHVLESVLPLLNRILQGDDEKNLPRELTQEGPLEILDSSTWGPLLVVRQFCAARSVEIARRRPPLVQASPRRGLGQSRAGAGGQPADTPLQRTRLGPVAGDRLRL